ncbi:MAG: Rnase Y domain-containing protein, partial [Acidimicrobiia bacterium]|nr:Rnase Y domain-containing protein [Acidimicrobiia bacterium]
MESFTTVVVGSLAVLVAAAAGYFFAVARSRRSIQGAELDSESMLTEARLEAQRLLTRAEEEARAIAETYRDREDATLEHRRIEVKSSEDRISHREETLEQRATNLAQREQMLINREEELTGVRTEAERLREEARANLERLAGFDSRAAKEELLTQVEDEARREAMILVRDMEVKAREEADRRAKRILTTAVQRLASDVVSESTVSMVELPTDDMKGRIIGREGRNIRAFE